MEYRKLRVMISGGGTGGHIFPAVSIADALKRANPESEILFVGAEGRMEMQKVPAAGYRIVGLPVAGLQRKLTLHNIAENLRLPFRLLASLRKAGGLIREFRPDVVVGVGGYASAPLLWQASRRHIPTLIQEQNGFAGLTNRILSKKAGVICVAYDGMERFFPADKIVFTGNPIRSDIHPYSPEDRAEGLAHYGFGPGHRQLLVVGGSLGSRTLNRSMMAWIEAGCPGGEDVQVLWQCGSYYEKEVDAFMESHPDKRIHHSSFISRMDLTYAMSDVIISRSGASSISEICAAGKAAVFVPSPNVAEDHQTHNAMALVRHGAAVMVRDADALQKLLPTAMELIHDPERIAEMERNVSPLARRDAAQAIAEEVYALLG